MEIKIADGESYWGFKEPARRVLLKIIGNLSLPTNGLAGTIALISHPSCKHFGGILNSDPPNPIPLACVQSSEMKVILLQLSRIKVKSNGWPFKSCFKEKDKNSKSALWKGRWMQIKSCREILVIAGISRRWAS